jgi:hypothetical protein
LRSSNPRRRSPRHPSREPRGRGEDYRRSGTSMSRFFDRTFPVRRPGVEERQHLPPSYLRRARTVVLTRPEASLVSGRRLPLHGSQSLDPTCHIPSVELPLTRQHRGFRAVHPSGLPHRLWPLDGTAALGLDCLSFALRRYQRRTSGWGQAIEHGPGRHLRHRRPPIEYPLNSCDLFRPRSGDSRAGAR